MTTVTEYAARLGRILDAAGSTATERRSAVADHLAARGLRAAPDATPAALVDRFAALARAARAECVATPCAGLAEAVAAALAGLPPEAVVRVADHPWLAGLAAASNRDLRGGTAQGGDAAGVTVAAAAIAETGAVVVTSAPATPTLLAFLPPLSVIVVGRSTVVARYEDAFARVTAGDPAAMPRNLDFVLGPSRTGDIEEMLLIGVHGPHRVVVVLVEDL